MPDFFVIRTNEPQNWGAIGVYTGTDGADACGIAALDKDLQGKFTAFPLTSGATRSVEIEPSATLTEVPFSDE